jgi:hypothetical protein
MDLARPRAAYEQAKGDCWPIRLTATGSASCPPHFHRHRGERAGGCEGLGSGFREQEDQASGGVSLPWHKSPFAPNSSLS